jgi:hypothetical protein
MSDSERKPMRRFDELDSREQSKLITQLRMEVAKLLGRRVLAVSGAEQDLTAQEKLEAHTRYYPFLN